MNDVGAKANPSELHFADRLLFVREQLNGALDRVDVVVRAARVSTPPYDPAFRLQFLIDQVYETWKKSFGADGNDDVCIRTVGSEAEAVAAIDDLRCRLTEMEQRQATLSPTPSTAVDGGERPPDGSRERPEEPTVAYCLIPPMKARWVGETELQPRLFHLLAVLLQHPTWPVPFDAVEGVIGDKGKNVSNAVSALNLALEAIKFPWTFRTKGGYITKD
jgi:hypothetical protein